MSRSGGGPVTIDDVETPLRAPADLVALAGAQAGTVSVTQCRAHGLDDQAVAALCRRGGWRPLFRGVYQLDADLLGEPEDLTRVRAALLAHGADAVAVGVTAALLHGLQGVPHGDPEVSLPPSRGRAQRSGVRLRWYALRAEEVQEVAGVRVTTPVRTLGDLLLVRSREESLSAVDSAVHQGVVPPEGLSEVAESLRRRRRGVRRALAALALADGRAESPLETRVRLACVDGGVAPHVLQLPVHDQRGVLVGRADFGWDDGDLLGEADGASVHGVPDAVFRDRHRQNDLAACGRRVLRFTWADTLRAGVVAAAVRRARGSGRLGRSARWI